MVTSQTFNKITSKIKKILLDFYTPKNFKNKQSQFSLLLPVCKQQTPISERLFNVSLNAINEARRVDLQDISKRISYGPAYPDIWPGEHYKLLAGIINTLKPKLVIEIGTFTGLSALTMKKYMRPSSKLITFDIIHWQTIKNTCLHAGDFSDGTLIQIIDDLGEIDSMNKHHHIFESADIIFVDGPKDGIFEKKLIKNLNTVNFKHSPLVIFDDIRLWNMIEVWHSIDRSKIDLTSFGHWAGTGLIDWTSN